MDMLEPTTNDHHHDSPLPAFEEIDSAAPLSVSAPRATAVALQAPNRPADRLSDLVARSEMALVHLESRLNDERSASERAVRATAEMEERLRLGVRMLQALDMQVERGEQAAAQSQEMLARSQELLAQTHGQLHAITRSAESSMKEAAENLVHEKMQWIERELAWRFDRVREVEDRIEHAANSKLAWLDGELGQRLGRLNDACAQAEGSLVRAETMFARLNGATEMLDRAERVASTLTAASAESATQIEVLSQRTNDAVALREAIGTISHEVTASREVVAGELRRMRDDLFWLTDRGERISAQLIEQADSAAACSQALRAQTDAASPVLAELSEWMPLVSGESRGKIRPITEALSSRVRDTLAADMRGFSQALRQFAEHADHAFVPAKLDPALVEFGAKANAGDMARSFAFELSRLGQMPVIPEARIPEARIPEARIPEARIPAPTSNGPRAASNAVTAPAPTLAPVMSVNGPLELSI